MADPKTPKDDVSDPTILETDDASVDAGASAKIDDAEVTEPVDPVITRAEFPSHPEPVSSASRGGAGAVSLLLGGALAAGIGFVAARYAVPDGWPFPGQGELSQRLSQQEGQIASVATEVEGIKAAPAGADEARVAGLEAEVAALRSALDAAAQDSVPRLTALEDRVTQLENTPSSGGGISPAELSVLQGELATLKDQVASQAGAGAGILSDVQAAADAAEARLQEAEAQAATLKADAEAVSKAAAVSGAKARIQAALESGAPYPSALQDLATQGVEVPQILTDSADAGVPSLTMLQANFPDAARTALDASLKATVGEGFGDRVSSFLRSTTGARSLTPREGSDPDAILSRAEAAIWAGDLPGALTEIAALPPEGVAAMQPWTDQAQLRLDATAAVNALSAE